MEEGTSLSLRHLGFPSIRVTLGPVSLCSTHTELQKKNFDRQTDVLFGHWRHWINAGRAGDGLSGLTGAGRWWPPHPAANTEQRKRLSRRHYACTPDPQDRLGAQWVLPLDSNRTALRLTKIFGAIRWCLALQARLYRHHCLSSHNFA